METTIWGLGFRVSVVGFRVLGIREVWGLGLLLGGFL